MLIYSEHITPRLRYIAEVFFGECYFTSSPVDFFEADIPKINYSHNRFSEDEFHIRPHGLLNETVIKQQQISTRKWDEWPVFFLANSNEDIPFDIFSAAFYLLSRYEEYLPHEKDAYGRFSHEESLAYKEHFLDKPLVNAWMLSLYGLLKRMFPVYEAPVRKFSFIPTYDIDIAFAEGRGWLRDLVKIIRRKRTKANGRDVFDVYGWLNELHVHRSAPIYFFLVAKYRGRYDKNLSPRSAKLQRLIRNTAKENEVGIHPSWQSYHSEKALKDEIRMLEKISRADVTASRQHYIQFTLPHTYRELIKAGITDEYSMGYGSINGFRASYAAPFYWYDLMQNEKTALLVHPFCYMEANSYFEQKFSVEEAANELQYYHDTVKEVNGELITIFHNHFLTEEPQWLPWREMYEDFLDKNFKRKHVTFPFLPE